MPPDHAFWKTHSPPNGWGCKCRILGVRSAKQAKRLGGDPDKALPKGWDQVDPKTGELPGIDKGWGYQPGESALDAVQATAKKTVNWDYRLAKAYMDEVPATQRDALATAIRSQPETGDAVRRYAQRVAEKVEADVPPFQTMGLLTSAEATQIAELTGVETVATELYDYAVDANTVLHIQEKHGSPGGEASRGQIEVIASDYAVAPRIIAQSDRVWAEDEGATVMMEKVLGEKRYVLAWEVRRQRRMVALSSMRIHRHTPRAQRPDRS